MVVEVAFNFSVRAAIPSKNQGIKEINSFGASKILSSTMIVQNQ